MAQLPIGAFLTERLEEYDPNFELRKGTAFESLFFKPMEFIVQPLRDEANDIFIAQSFNRILAQDDPNAFDEESVDALASNLFVNRREGNTASGVVRVLYNEPVDREFPATGANFVSSNGDIFENTSPFRITIAQMSTQIQDGLYYYDLPIQSQETGDIQVGVNEIVDFLSDTAFVRVENSLAFSSGVPRETNTELIERVKSSIAVRDLVTGKGFNGILFENFPNFIQELQPIGFGDIEMMRDVIFNTHVGGKVDGYVKTFNITQGSFDVIGLLVDETRQAFTINNAQLFGTDPTSLSQPNVDRSNDRAPVVKEIKVSVAAEYISTEDLSTPLDLTSNQYIRIGIDGAFLDIRVVGAVISATNRNEIINVINAAFGRLVAFPEGDTIKIKSPTAGLTSRVVIDTPTIGTSAISQVFGLSDISAPHEFVGDGPETYVEGSHYTIDDGFGRIQRVLGPTIIATETDGQSTLDSDVFSDPTLNAFLSVAEKDIVTIEAGPDAGDYRIIEKIDNNNLRLDAELSATDNSVQYSIRRTGIKNGEVVQVEFYYNPLSIDIGALAVLDDLGRERGIRIGREEQTITDTPLLRVRSVEIIDPLTREPTGTVLDGSGGYGQGGYGRGGYGIGDGSEWRLVVVKPTERFSMFEESFIVINAAYQGLSFRVNYDYVPEISQLHDFVRSESERVLDGDILMKHFLPAYVSGTIRYSVDETDSTIPTNEELETLLEDFIDQNIRAGEDLEYSDIIQFIVRTVDPFDRYSAFVEPFKLEATIHNTDGTIVRITGDSRLRVPALDPFPKYTTRPLTPRITHWISDDLVLERIASGSL